MTVLADTFEGKPLNSPNDLVYKSDGSLYFTDPPFGLPKFFDDPRKDPKWATIAGIVGDVRHRGVDEPARPELYQPHAQSPYRSMILTVRQSQWLLQMLLSPRARTPWYF